MSDFVQFEIQTDSFEGRIVDRIIQMYTDLNKINLIETNHQINMTSDYSVSSNNSFKSLLNAKSDLNV